MSDDILDLIAGWCADETDLDLVEGEIEVAGDPPLRIDLTVDEERVMLSHEHRNDAVSEDFADAARRLLTRPGSMVRGTVEAAPDHITATVEYPVYRSGLNSQTFLLAVRDVAGTVDGLNEAASAATEPGAGDAAEEPAELAETEASRVESTEELPAAMTAGGAEEPWAPTHVVPGGGMNAWAEPDPSQSPTAALEARVELRLDEMRGAWAHVTGSNGWTGWVDGRRLTAIEGGTAVAAGTAPRGFGVVQAGTLSIRLFPLFGGITLLLSAFLPWESFGQLGLDVKPFDLPLAVLWGKGTPSQPELGLALVILGVAAIVLAFLPRVPRWAVVTAGILGAACAVLFFVQLGRAANWRMGDIFDILAVGFWIAFAGGILTTIGGRTT
jgi:hypothetical protein